MLLELLAISTNCGYWRCYLFVNAGMHFGKNMRNSDQNHFTANIFFISGTIFYA